MESNHLYTFKELLEQGILGSDSSRHTIEKLRIPRIQRSYAQGRKSEFDIRENFLNEIFTALTSNNSLEMSFVYGAFDNGVFDILDGQQRLTTVFLVNWYILMRERQDLKSSKWLDKFCYETRKTSTDFISKLVSENFIFNETPKAEIESRKWFVLSYRQDSTVTSMITMLNAIHDKYQKLCCTNLAGSLDNLKFYLIPLDEYGLSEDLYIKMNARGLRLTPFDNFKADLVNYLRSNSFNSSTPLPGSTSCQTVPYDLYFSIQMDNSWIDLFWKIDGKKYDSLFFRFFYRYMSSKCITAFKSTIAYDQMKEDIDYLFFADVSENQQDKYKGFSAYSNWLSFSYVKDMDNILNILKDHYLQDIKPYLTSPWGDTAFMFDDSSKFERKSQIIFSSIIEYLGKTTTTSFSAVDFRQWMRVVWNIVENSNIDGLQPQMGVMRRLADIVNFGCVGSVYASLSTYSGTNLSMSVTEEVEKAKLVVRPNTTWEKSFIKAESNPFLKGMVSFFCDYSSPSFTPQVFDNRYKLVNQMFCKDGISQVFKKEHVLIRAIISCFNDWWTTNKLMNLRFTERVESGTFLKNMIRSNKNVWSMFNKLLARAGTMTINDVIDGLSQVISVASPNSNCLPMDGGKSGRPGMHAFEIAYKRLTNDKALYDWISEEETNQRKYFKIYYAYDHIWATIPFASYARTMLDTDRDTVINMLRVNLGLDYEDQNQAGMYDRFKFHFGFDISLVKLFKGRKFKLTFRWDNRAILFIKYDNDAERQLLQNAFNVQTNGKDGYLQINEVNLSDDCYMDILGMYNYALLSL